MLKLPKFENESEEARWWYDHREDLDTEFEKAAADGTLGEGTIGRLARKRKAMAAAEAAQSTELSGLLTK